MRPVNEIVTRKAKLAIENAQAAAAAEGRTLSERTIASRVAKFMGDANSESVLKQLRRQLAGKSTWRVDYIEGLCQAVGAMPHELMSFEPDDVAEATRAQYLVSSLEKRLDPKEMRAFARAWNRLADSPERMEIAFRFVDSLSKLDDKADTKAVSDLYAWTTDVLVGMLKTAMTEKFAPKIQALLERLPELESKSPKSASLRGKKK